MPFNLIRLFSLCCTVAVIRWLWTGMERKKGHSTFVDIFQSISLRHLSFWLEFNPHPHSPQCHFVFCVLCKEIVSFSSSLFKNAFIFVNDAIKCDCSSRTESLSMKIHYSSNALCLWSSKWLTISPDVTGAQTEPFPLCWLCVGHWMVRDGSWSANWWNFSDFPSREAKYPATQATITGNGIHLNETNERMKKKNMRSQSDYRRPCMSHMNTMP